MNKLILQTKKSNHDSDCAIYVKEFIQFFKSMVIGPFNFKVTTGKMHAIIGASGSGKTVFIKSLIGGYAKHYGIIKILGKNIKDLEVKKKIGYVPEFITFPEKISAYNFLKFMGLTNGVYGQELKNRIRTLMISLGLWEHRNKDVNSFSSGMKKRVMIIQGIIHNPDILILDEPEAGLDIANRKKVIKYLKFLTLKGKTVFFSSHLLDEIKDYIDEYTLVINGRQIQTGTLKHLDINKTYYIVVDNNERFLQFFKANNVKNWYDKDTKRINFVIQNPLHLQFVTKFAEQHKIKIFKIGQTEFSFDFLLKKDNLIKLEQKKLAIKQNSKNESD